MSTASNDRFPLRPGRRVLVANPWDQSRKKPGVVAGARSYIDLSSGLPCDQYLVTFDHRPGPMWVPTYLVHEFKLTAVEPAQQENRNDQNAT